PAVGGHGWQRPHAAVEGLDQSRPFLVDAGRTELNRRGYSIHTLQTTVLGVRRGAAGELLELLPKGTAGDAVLQESLMYLEIDRCANVSELNVLARELEQVRGEVRAAVEEVWPPDARLLQPRGRIESNESSAGAADTAAIHSCLHG
ncbi:hypothetical protein EWW49_35145, partial [Pseudomonas syringae]